MRFQGSFACEPISQEKKQKESLAETDVSRVRCAKDEWQIHNETIIFTRTLYQTKECENILGRIQFSSSSVSENGALTHVKPKCKFVRVNPGWLGEDSGKCMINQLVPNQPYDLHSVYRCTRYVPQFCEQASSLRVESNEPAGGHDPFAEIKIETEGGGHLMSCKRYAAE